jgi:hypothetical protein
MSNLTLFKNGGVASTAFKGVDLPRARLDEGVESSPWCRISYKGRDWAVKDGAASKPLTRIVEGREEKNPNLDIVILKAANHPTKRWYEADWTDDANSPPDCWSTLGFKPDAAAPKKQDEGKGCLNCKWNAWASKGGGSRGKACSDYKHLAVVPVGDIMNLTHRGPMLLAVPPNSLKILGQYQAELEGLGFHYAQVHTRVTFASGQESTFQFKFDALAPLDDVQAGQVVKMLQHPLITRMLDEEMAGVAGDVDRQAAPSVAAGAHKIAALPAAPEAKAPAEKAPEPVAKQREVVTPPIIEGFDKVEQVAETQDPPCPEGVDPEDWAAIQALKRTKAASPAKPRGRRASNGPRTPAVAPKNMDSEALAGPPLPAPVGPSEEVQAPGNDPALDAINQTLNRAKDLVKDLI